MQLIFLDRDHQLSDVGGGIRLQQGQDLPSGVIILGVFVADLPQLVEDFLELRPAFIADRVIQRVFGDRDPVVQLFDDLPGQGVEQLLAGLHIDPGPDAVAAQDLLQQDRLLQLMQGDFRGFPGQGNVFMGDFLQLLADLSHGPDRIA